MQNTKVGTCAMSEALCICSSNISIETGSLRFSLLQMLLLLVVVLLLTMILPVVLYFLPPLFAVSPSLFISLALVRLNLYLDALYTTNIHDVYFAHSTQSTPDCVSFRFYYFFPPKSTMEAVFFSADSVVET